jgi:hypothetical protein
MPPEIEVAAQARQRTALSGTKTLSIALHHSLKTSDADHSQNRAPKKRLLPGTGRCISAYRGIALRPKGEIFEGPNYSGIAQDLSGHASASIVGTPCCYCYLGKSRWPTDALLRGSLAEVRIWNPQGRRRSSARG